MTSNFGSPDDQINRDITARMGNPMFNQSNPFDPKLFVTPPKDLIQAALMANRNQMQVIDACNVMAKVNQRELKRIKHSNKKLTGKLNTRSKSAAIIKEFDIRSRSIDHLAVNYAAQTMTFIPPQQDKKKKDLDQL